MGPVAFPDPEKLNPHRPKESYAALLGPLLMKTAGPAIAAVLKQVFSLQNIRQARGSPGKFTTVDRELEGMRLRKYLDSNASESPFPTNLMLEYDEEAPYINGYVSANGVAS